MRFAATAFVQILKRKPGLETAAFLIVGWVGVKLAVYTLAHPCIKCNSTFIPVNLLRGSLHSGLY